MTYRGLVTLRGSERTLTVVLGGGFEDRVRRTVELLGQLRISCVRGAILTYGGAENASNLSFLRAELSRIVGEANVALIDSSEPQEIEAYISTLNSDVDELLIDVTGFTRVLMMQTMSIAYDRQIPFKIVYTEAEEYYPRKEDFELLTQGAESEEAFFKLSEYEDANTMYSRHCVVQQIRGLEGSLLPNYPMILVAFLTFKRARVSAVLQAFEANTKILVKGLPRRDDLKWRAEAITYPNLDLIDDSEIVTIDTLDWRETFFFLNELYERDNNKYRCNFVVAPLGSKMQTLGAWAFAKRNVDVMVVTSTPTRLFHDKYSIGHRETFLVDDPLLWSSALEFKQPSGAELVLD